MILTSIEHVTLTAIVGLNDGAIAEHISQHIKYDTGRALAARDLVRVLT